MGSLARGDSTALQQHGQKLYQQGRFDAAIEAFTETLKFKDVDLLGVLDNRAATYSKLAQYDRALRDARQMIKRDKQDERGYLRCAKTLLLDGKPEKALELVEQLHNKLQDKMVAKCHDPFTVLPYEIARMVLEHLDFKQIVAILRVSKQWDRFLSSMRDLWMRIDLSDARGKIHWSSVRALIRRSKAMLTHAVVKNVSTSSTQRVLEFFSRCPRLESLDIWAQFGCQSFYELFKGSKRLKSLMISGEMTVPQEYISKFLASLPALERVEIHRTKSSPQSKAQWPSKLPHLRSITLGTIESSRPSEHVPALYIPRREDSLPSTVCNLEELRLESNPAVFIPYPPTFNPLDLLRLRRLDLSGVFIGDDFALPSSLEYLRVRGGAGADEFPFSNEAPFQLPHLHTLILSDVPWATNSTILVFIVDAKSPLKTLHVDSCLRLPGLQFSNFICEHAPQLTDLNISHVSGISDSVIESFVTKLPELKVLTLSFTEVTGCSVKTFADAKSAGTGGTNLERVYARGCEYMSSDAVAYGRANGIEIFT
ncbi:hypothetical protein FE257_011457 [Aspergillus nanangensis]|uniref:F-box domain-containing protein n=1 Tax=Aspergillus nanangensis TaxID=2582783 RepID=A0AAD4CH85_ASPNN|nr:hypothetical protein FE257_011457 [Aspergillus nanangensis]